MDSIAIQMEDPLDLLERTVLGDTTTVGCSSSTCQGTDRYITRGRHCGNHQG